jgi:hypothetical protein
MMKFCSQCKEELSLDSFNIRAKSSDGRDACCKSCRSIRRKNYKSTKEYNKKYYSENSTDMYLRKELWYKNNPDKKIKHRKNYRAANLSKIRESERLKNIVRRTRVPSWLTLEQKEDINNFYKLRDEAIMLTGDSYHVDHIVPLQGKLVCGLHVPWNLQVLPADLNLRKGNCFAGNTGGGEAA